MPMPGNWNLYGGRLWRAAKLDAALYEEVEADTTALPQAITTVLLSSLAPALAQAGQGIFSVLSHLAVSLAGWFVWAGVAYAVGAKLFPEPETRADMGEMLRCTGFSAAPGMIALFGFGLPVLQALLSLVSVLWMLGAFSLATQRALDYRSFPRAVAVSIAGLVAMIILRGIAEWGLDAWIG